MSELSPLIQAQQTFLNVVPTQSTGEEQVDLSMSRGRVASVDVAAPHDLPPYPRAIVEGYLARTADTAGASEAQPKTLRVVGHIKPGDEQCAALKPGEVVEVTTGCLVHGGEFSIVRAWEAERNGVQITVKRSFPPGFFIENQGSELKAGQTILPRGTVLGPWEIGTLASFGISQVSVARPPIVAVFSSGDEVIAFTRPVRPGQIRDCNSVMLSAAIEEAGGVARFVGIMGDDFDRFLSAIKNVIEGVDAVVISGGTAIGGKDFITNLITAAGTTVCVDGVPMKSGRPLIMGVCGNKPIVCVAGHPPEALRGFRLFGAPALAKLLGRPVTLPADAA